MSGHAGCPHRKIKLNKINLLLICPFLFFENLKATPKFKTTKVAPPFGRAFLGSRFALATAKRLDLYAKIPVHTCEWWLVSRSEANHLQKLFFKVHDDHDYVDNNFGDFQCKFHLKPFNDFVVVPAVDCLWLQKSRNSARGTNAATSNRS